MKLYLAPMEEITGYVFRNVLNKHFPYVDKYFTPFVTPNQNKILKTREGRELIPEHNEGLNVVPQILTNNAEYFNDLAYIIKDMGYKEININIGCPSNTVCKKYKGSGMLRDLDLLDGFLDGVYEGAGKDLTISVKTRLGYTSDEYFDDILDVYNKYPISELIIHPRIQKEFYSGLPHMDKFDMAYELCKMPLCYNGNIFYKEDFKKIADKYDKLDSVMIGRGAVFNPAIFKEIKGEAKADKNELKNFIEDLYEVYCQEFGTNDGLFKMKEVWSYFKDNFENIDKEIKAIRKTTSPIEYKAIVKGILR